MFENTLVVIPARAGSKGIPNKNIKLLKGNPLVYYTIKVALEIFPKDNICLSTDSKEIIDIAKELGLQPPFIRPKILANDYATTYDVLIHALTFYIKRNRKFEKLLLLQPTSPFRRVEHILEAMQLYSENIDMVMSVKEADANPYFVLYEENNEGYLQKSKKGKFFRRQDCPKVWQANGAIYIYNVDSLVIKNPLRFEKVIKYEMNPIHSLDLDTNLDWEFAEFLIEKKDF